MDTDEEEEVLEAGDTGLRTIVLYLSGLSECRVFATGILSCMFSSGAMFGVFIVVMLFDG
jgi:hypothetical protein